MTIFSERDAAHFFGIKFKHQRVYEPLESIRRVVQKEFNLTTNEMLGRQRARKISFPRFIGYWLSRQLTHSSLPEIARVYNRDHTTIINGVRRVNEWEKTRPDWWDKANEIREEFI